MALHDIWFYLIAVVLLLYLVLDGFDLGVGILHLRARDEDERSVLMGSVSAVWHANQTWLVVAGGLLFAAFPMVYARAFTALYLPVTAMIAGFILRGVSLEFRHQSSSPAAWDLAFGGGSLLATVSQGLVAGALVSGLSMEGQRFAGSFMDWLNPVSLLFAFTLTFVYVLLGATYLILKTEGEVRSRSAAAARTAAILTWEAMVAGVLWLSLDPSLQYAAGDAPLVRAVVLAAVVTGLFIALLRCLEGPREGLPFALSLTLAIVFFGSVAAAAHPYVIPPSITAPMAAAPPVTLTVLLAVVGVFLPVMLFYNAYQYFVFRGKARGGYKDEG